MRRQHPSRLWCFQPRSSLRPNAPTDERVRGHPRISSAGAPSYRSNCRFATFLATKGVSGSARVELDVSGRRPWYRSVAYSTLAGGHSKFQCHCYFATLVVVAQPPIESERAMRPMVRLSKKRRKERGSNPHATRITETMVTRLVLGRTKFPTYQEDWVLQHVATVPWSNDSDGARKVLLTTTVPPSLAPIR